MKKILVTPRSVTKKGHPALDRLRKAGFEVVFCTPGQQPSEEELLKLLPGCVGFLAGVEPVTAKVLSAAKDLKVISRNGTGVDNIDLDAAAKLNIKVMRAEGANARGVAELAFGHILGAVRAIPASDRALKNETWERFKGIELEGKTLGIVGCGRIGKLVARFALAFDMKVLACDPYPDKAFKPGKDFRFAALDEVLEKSDIVTLHCPPPKDGKPIISAETIARMKRGAYLVNTARGSLMEDAAVIKALDEGRLSGVAVDAFEPEPPDDWRLAKHPKVIATPHVGGFTDESVDRAVSVAVDNLLAELGR
jgi:D-3-phosphoglycerate dehydrogenase